MTSTNLTLELLETLQEFLQALQPLLDSNPTPLLTPATMVESLGFLRALQNVVRDGTPVPPEAILRLRSMRDMRLAATASAAPAQAAESPSAAPAQAAESPGAAPAQAAESASAAPARAAESPSTGAGADAAESPGASPAQAAESASTGAGADAAERTPEAAVCALGVDQIQFSPALQGLDIARLNRKMGLARKYLRAVRGDRTTWDHGVDTTAHYEAAWAYMYALLRCLAAILPTTPTTVDEDLHHALRRMKKMISSGEKARGKCVPGESPVTFDVRKQFTEFFRTDGRHSPRVVVTQSRMDAFDAQAVMSCVQFCTRVAMFCHAFDESVKGSEDAPQKVLDLCERMRTHEPSGAPIVLQLVQFDGGLPTPPQDARAAFFKLFPFQKSLCDFTDSEFKATTNYLLTLLVKAHHALVAGIRKLKVAADVMAARRQINAKSFVHPGDCDLMSSQAVMEELGSGGIGTFRALLLVYTLFKRMRRVATVFDPDGRRYPSAALAALADNSVQRLVKAWPSYNPSN